MAGIVLDIAPQSGWIGVVSMAYVLYAGNNELSMF